MKELDERQAIKEKMEKTAQQESASNILSTEGAKKETKLGDVSPNVKVNRSAFIFDHLKNKDDIRKDYQINDVLGSGAFGEVRKCIHKQ